MLPAPSQSPVKTQAKQTRFNRAKGKAIQARTGFKKAYKLSTKGVEDIKRRDKKTKRTKEALVSAQWTEMGYNKQGKWHAGMEENPWGGDVSKMEDAFKKYRNDPKNEIVWEDERQNVRQNIDTTKQWYDYMTRTQWAVETEHGGTVRNFHYEQQAMNHLTNQKEAIESTAETSTDLFI